MSNYIFDAYHSSAIGAIQETEFDGFIKKHLNKGDVIRMYNISNGEESWYYQIVNESYRLEDYDYNKVPKVVACVYCTYDLPPTELPTRILVDPETKWCILAKESSPNYLMVHALNPKKFLKDTTVNKKSESIIKM